MNFLNKLLTGLLFFSLLILFTSIYFYYSFSSNLIAVHEVGVELSIGGEVGINLDVDPMNFGTVNKEGFSKRSVIYNTSEEGYLYVVSEGSIDGLLFYDSFDNNLYKGVNTISLVAYGGAEEGVYTGVLYFYLFKKEPNFLQKLFIGRDLSHFDREEARSGVYLRVS